jgi:DNA-binding response OmpR family regulator
VKEIGSAASCLLATRDFYTVFIFAGYGRSMRILIVAGNDAIAGVIRQGLEGAGYPADRATDGLTGLRLAGERGYALVILERLLPEMDGLRACEELRRRRNRVPLLVLAARDALDDRVRVLDAGADDYLAYPFDIKEFLARVRALLRRDRVQRGRVIRAGDLEIDTDLRLVTRAGVEIRLSRREYDLLEALAAHEGHVLTRQTIQERVWMNETATAATVDVYIGLLRKKVDAGRPVRLIQTVHGVGYRLRAPEPPPHISVAPSTETAP